MTKLSIPRRRKEQSKLKKLLGYFAVVRILKTGLTLLFGARRAAVVGALAVPAAVVGAVVARKARAKADKEATLPTDYTPPAAPVSPSPVAAATNAAADKVEEAAGGPPNESAQPTELVDAAKNGTG